MVNNKKKRSKLKKKAKEQARQQTQQASSSSPPSTSNSITSTGNTNASSPTSVAHYDAATFESGTGLTVEQVQFQTQCMNELKIKIRTLAMIPERLPGIIFIKKLTGAFARLFAHGCSSYLVDISITCNDTFQSLPVWSSLSPQQRLRLVTEVMVGLLCEDEPLDLIQTEQHFVAYLGIMECIQTKIDEELDLVWEELEGGNELEIIQKSHPAMMQPSSYYDSDSDRETEEEKQERLRKAAITSKLAARQKKKLDKKMEKGMDAALAKEKAYVDADADADIAENKKDKKEDKTLDLAHYQFERWGHLFKGGPPSQSLRASFRPKLEDLYDDDNEDNFDRHCGDRRYETNEEFSYQEVASAFEWRLKCDDAFQENDEPTHIAPIPLKYVNFNWKLNDRHRWMDALFVLFLESGGVVNLWEADEMLPFHHGLISEDSYLDPKMRQHIINIKKTAQEWRASFDESYNETQFYQEHRCIYAVCEEQHWCPGSHRKWLESFIAGCKEENFTIFKTPGNYQKRLNVYRSLIDLDTPSTFYHSNLVPPVEFKLDEYSWDGLSYDSCNADGCYRNAGMKMKKCSGCKVVKYCSRECQKRDWANHKKDCKAFAKIMQDKAQIANICKKTSD